MTRKQSASSLGQLQRDAYMISKYARYARALRRGRLPRAVLRTQYHRRLIALLRRGGLW